jgi:hypothetical protein
MIICDECGEFLVRCSECHTVHCMECEDCEDAEDSIFDNEKETDDDDLLY